MPAKDKPMIHFLRRIRQRLLAENKFTKYLLYAIGEIFLVVIGILIALQVNNWNQQRIKDARFEFGLTALYSEIQSTVFFQSGVLDSLDFQTKLIDSLLQQPNSLKLHQIPAMLLILDESGIVAWNNDWKSEFLEMDTSRPDRNRFAQALRGLTNVSSGIDEIIKKHHLDHVMKSYLRTYHIPYTVYNHENGTSYADFINASSEDFYSDSQLQQIHALIDDESLKADLRTLKELKRSTREYAVSAGQSADAFLSYIQSYTPDRDYSLKQMEVIGTGLPNGQWATGIRMKWMAEDVDSRWELKQELADGKLKFRGDMDWVLDWGRGQANDARLVFKGADIPVSQGLYHINIDLKEGTYEFIPIGEQHPE